MLLALIDAAPFQLQAYCQLIGLTHGIRMAIRGAPRELSFQCPVPIPEDPCQPTLVDVYCAAPCLPADALAAIVGPCKDLVRLTLPHHNIHHPSVLGLGLMEHDACRAWAEEAFGGHTQLAVLEIPGAGTFWPAIGQILSHLPGLEEFHFLEARPLRTRVLQALATFCPKLRVLHLTQHSSAQSYGQHFTVLKPLAGTIKELILPDAYIGRGPLTALVQCLSSLERLEVNGGDMRFLWPVAPHLTHLSTRDPFVGGIEEVGFCRLESLTSESTSDNTYAKVLTTCRDTLRSVSLFTKAPVFPLAPLGGLTHLTRLKLTLRDRSVTLAAVLAALPPGVLENQLEYLDLELGGDDCTKPAFIRSRSLREVNIRNHTRVTLDCPRLLSDERRDSTDLWPELVLADGLNDNDGQAMTTDPRQTMICRLNNGPRFFELRLATTGPPAFLLRLPEQFEFLDGSIEAEGQETQGPPAELRVEAPVLRTLRLEVPPKMRLTLACPALGALVLTGGSSLVLAEGTDPPLRTLCLEPIRGRAPRRPKDDSVLAVLTRHGSHLQRVSLCSRWLPPTDWPEVAAALGRLPRLFSLELPFDSADMVLACPRLSHLSVSASKLRSLVLDCPQLEELWASFDSDLERFELTADRITYIGGVKDSWKERLQERFPRAYLANLRF
ncbi:hypothetical protein PAPYR_11325 [Paratrimastix pyriformis]|uniref:Uncharacterized protein n=1 Tax=Paratrimastix pyriformis TaxID=342808 RepID=A0ABQ8U7V3_9EUKA|nr:hypothetical protein PAPYR_11325 [Paratrimastix pyriformis]